LKDFIRVSIVPVYLKISDALYVRNNPEFYLAYT